MVHSDAVHIVRTVPSCVQNAAPVNGDIAHVKANFRPIIWVPELAIFIVPKNKVAPIQECKWLFGRNNNDGKTFWNKSIVFWLSLWYLQTLLKSVFIHILSLNHRHHIAWNHCKGLKLHYAHNTLLIHSKYRRNRRSPDRSLIYNYLCNQCLSPQTLWVRISPRRGVFDATLCDKICQWLATDRWFSPVSSTNKTDRHNITEMLLKVALNTIN
jgi:hypothetical protein